MLTQGCSLGQSNPDPRAPAPRGLTLVQHKVIQRSSGLSRNYLPSSPFATGRAQADRYFQVLTKAVGMREYGTVVTLLQVSDEGS